MMAGFVILVVRDERFVFYLFIFCGSFSLCVCVCVCVCVACAQQCLQLLVIVDPL